MLARLHPGSGAALVHRSARLGAEVAVHSARRLVLARWRGVIRTPDAQSDDGTGPSGRHRGIQLGLCGDRRRSRHHGGRSGAPGTLGRDPSLRAPLAVEYRGSRNRAQPGPSGRALTRPLVLGTLTLAVAAVVCTLVIPQFSASRVRRRRPRGRPDGDRRSHHPDGRAGRAAGGHGVEPGTRTLFVVRMNKPSSGYLAAVDLDSYDGDIWSLQHTLNRPAGRVRLARRHRTDQPGRVRGGPALQGASMPLPCPGCPTSINPTSVSGVGVDFDNQSG